LKQIGIASKTSAAYLQLAIDLLHDDASEMVHASEYGVFLSLVVWAFDEEEADAMYSSSLVLALAFLCLHECLSTITDLPNNKIMRRQLKQSWKKFWRIVDAARLGEGGQ